METETKLIVRYAETDKMGIVHHSNYPIWFEVGRTDFISKIGMHYCELEKEGVMLPLIDLKCSYKSPARYEDKIVIKTRINKLTFTRISFYYEVYKENECLPIATGETTHAWTDRNLKPINMKKHFPHVFEILKKVSEE